MTTENTKTYLKRPLPGEWMRPDTDFRYHWMVECEYPSIRIMDDMFMDSYAVEMYPSPVDGEDGVLRTTHGSLYEAFERVHKLMENEAKSE